MNMPPTFLQILKMNVSVPSWSLKNEVYRLKKKSLIFNDPTNVLGEKNHNINC